MATNHSYEIELLTLELARDQVAQDIATAEKFKKIELALVKIRAVEQRLNVLIDKAWVEEKVEQLSIIDKVAQSDLSLSTVITNRLTEIEKKLTELESKIWKHKE